MVKAVVLEEKDRISLRDIRVDETLGRRDVRIALRNVGICGSDVHYYTHGGIGPFIVRAPMILGHEASGVIVEVGADVTELKEGDRVCMEPGIPDPASKASRLGKYNLDPAVRFWATPPIHGVLRPTVVHPADFTFKLPDNVSLAAAALVEPLATGVHGATKAEIKPGDTALVTGAGPIGLVTLLAARAAGCARVFVSDVDEAKLELAKKLGASVTIDARSEKLEDIVKRETDGWGVDVAFECSGNQRVAPQLFEAICPGGRIIFIGMPVDPMSYLVTNAAVKEARVEHIFRYAHVFPRCVAMLGSGAIDVSPLITKTFGFEDSVRAFEFAARPPTGSVKVQIEMPS
jgi:D-xylulose reductase